MKYTPFLFILLAGLWASCTQPPPLSSIDPVNWKKRTLQAPLPDTLEQGTSYLSIYSQIYSETEKRIHDLTVTVSLRNLNETDSVFVDRASYFDTHGNLIRTYFANTIYIAPLETVEIVINRTDREGGTGANFLFDWRVRPGSHEPRFEAVMISAYGQQGLAFTTTAERIR